MNSQPTVYAVQGFFFQEQSFLGFGHRPVVGTVVTVDYALVRDMFAGIIGPNELETDLEGLMTDKYGASNLSNVTLSDTEFSFDKQYYERADVIHYTFHKDGDIWVGEYVGVSGVGRGEANCILTPIPMSMLQPS